VKRAILENNTKEKESTSQSRERLWPSRWRGARQKNILLDEKGEGDTISCIIWGGDNYSTSMDDQGGSILLTYPRFPPERRYGLSQKVRSRHI